MTFTQPFPGDLYVHEFVNQPLYVCRNENRRLNSGWFHVRNGEVATVVQSVITSSECIHYEGPDGYVCLLFASTGKLGWTSYAVMDKEFRRL